MTTDALYIHSFNSAIFRLKDSIFCHDCMASIRPVVSTTICITPKYTCRVFAVAAYQEQFKPLILAKGWGDRTASRQLGALIWDKTNIKYASFDAVVPIPLHWSRFAHRGFNQAEEIAQVVAVQSGKPLMHLLKRTRRTVFQSAIAANKRQDNVQHAFALMRAQKNLYKDKHILLVDDLMTTGATIKSAARELIKLQPASISVVVVCRVT